MSELQINRKIYPVGSVVYYIEKKGYKWSVNYGTVEENYTSEVCIQLYDIRDFRLIDGIPVNDFVTPTRWKKLPKGWSYDTKLFELTYKTPFDVLGNYDPKNPDDVLKAINDGVLVKVQDKDYAHFETEIDEKYGWRIKRNYPYGEHHPTYITVRYDKVYNSYADALKVINEHSAELQRQAALSDYEWSIEQIDEVLNRWKKLCSATEEDKQRYRRWILELDKVENIEVRIFAGKLQWKYWKNRKWMEIVL